MTDGWVSRNHTNSTAAYRRLAITTPEHVGIVVITPGTYATNNGFVFATVCNRRDYEGYGQDLAWWHQVEEGEGVSRPPKYRPDPPHPVKYTKINSLDEDEIERQLREIMRVLEMRRPVAKVRA